MKKIFLFIIIVFSFLSLSAQDTSVEDTLQAQNTSAQLSFSLFVSGKLSTRTYHDTLLIVYTIRCNEFIPNSNPECHYSSIAEFIGKDDFIVLHKMLKLLTKNKLQKIYFLNNFYITYQDDRYYGIIETIMGNTGFILTLKDIIKLKKLTRSLIKH
jgi:hypothetical protein